MKKHIKTATFFVFGWVFLLLGIIGIPLPILPTSPFVILAAAWFAKGSPRFHKLLIENKYFGSELKRWEETRVVARKTKKKATFLVVISFSFSMWMLSEKVSLQIMLILIAIVLLFFIWKLKEH